MSNKLTITGYCVPQNARPGDTIDFKVSTYDPGDYEADLVKVINGDRLTESGRFRMDTVASPFEGTYQGKTKKIHLGSYIEIDEHPALDSLSTFCVTAHIWPTTLYKGRQYLVSRWNDITQAGWALIINDIGAPAFLVGDGKGNIRELSAINVCQQKEWSQIVATYNADTGEAEIFMKHGVLSNNELLDWPPKRREMLTFAPAQTGPIRIAAACGAPGNAAKAVPIDVFNGKLDGVRLFHAIPDVEGFEPWGEEYLAIGAHTLPERFKSFCLANWDFSKEMSGIRIHDISGNDIHGEVINTPNRAMTGFHWDQKVHNWQDAPDQYSAIYFHDDDLYDAEWETDFSYQIPDDLPSGHYAVRLRHGDCDDYIPFFVLPPKGKATHNIAFLMSTAMYKAYANYTLGLNYRFRFPKTPLSATHDQFLEAHPEFGKSLYCQHKDGSEVSYSSTRRPMVNNRPGAQAYNYVSDTDILDFLNHENIGFDVITDDVLHLEGEDLLKNYDLVITGVHPEYYSTKMLDSVLTFTHTGGRLMYMGGNGFYWTVAYSDHLPDTMEVRRFGAETGEGYQAFDGEMGGLWHNKGRHPQALAGVGMASMAFHGPTYYERQDGSCDPRAAFIFDGVDDTIIGNFGHHYGGAAGEEIDILDYRYGTPKHTLHLARSKEFEVYAEADNPEERHDLKHADITFFETEGGGAVFSTGSIAWSSALNWNDFDNNVAHITRNVIKRFADPQPFEMPE